MEILTRDQFLAERARFDALALQTADIDNYCSLSAWGLAAHAAFHPDDACYFLRGKHGYAALSMQDHFFWGKTLTPLESSWLLGCPLVTDEPRAFLPELAVFLKTTNGFSWNFCALTGLIANGALAKTIVQVLWHDFKISHGPQAIRRVADLGTDLDFFLARRSAKFRKNLRRTERLVAAAGIDFEWWQEPMPTEQWPSLYARILEVETRAWKGREGHGIDKGDMCVFYKSLMAMQAPEGAIRIGFARLGARDVGYILGGVAGKTYRGYQFSYDVSCAELGLGNWMQVRAIERLSREAVQLYDLGSDMAYKRAWSDRALETISLVFTPNTDA